MSVCVSTAATIALSSRLAPVLCTYCARKVDGGSRNAIESVGHTSMQKIACRTKEKNTDDVPEPAMMLKQHREAKAVASTSSSSTSVCVRHAVCTGCSICPEHAHSVREKTCMPAALFPSAPLYE